MQNQQKKSDYLIGHLCFHYYAMPVKYSELTYFSAYKI